MCVKHPGFEVDLRVLSDIRIFAEAWRGIRNLRTEIAARRIRISGPTRLCRQFPGWLRLSELAPFPRKRPGANYGSCGPARAHWAPRRVSWRAVAPARSKKLATILLTALGLLPGVTGAAREPVLSQVKHPHNYYWRELYIPQLTTGPSSVAFMPSGDELVYSMEGSLWRQKIAASESNEITHADWRLRSTSRTSRRTAAASSSRATTARRSSSGATISRAAQSTR